MPVAWFRADEIGLRGRFHLHALVTGTAQLRRLSWMDEWNRRNGYARILAFDPKKGAAYYCAKYVTKQFGDWELGSSLGYEYFLGPAFQRRQK